MMLNDASGAKAWREHDVKLSQILNRNKNTANGSAQIWSYAKKNFIEPNLREGSIKEDCILKMD